MTIDGGLSGIFQSHLPKGIHWVRIESGFTMRGIPDANYCFNKKEGWVEFKVTHGNIVGLRPEQVGWLLRRSRAGGRCNIAVRKKTRSVDELYLIPGKDADRVKETGLKEILTGWCIWDGGPANWNWKTIESVLLT
jgi:Holliday junction resolvase